MDGYSEYSVITYTGRAPAAITDGFPSLASAKIEVERRKPTALRCEIYGRNLGAGAEVVEIWEKECVEHG